MTPPKTLLLVEDNAQDEFLILRAFRSANLAGRVDVVHDGQQALDYLLRKPEQDGPGRPPLPAVVLLDIDLPRVNGLEVLRRLRNDAVTRLLPVVMLTSSDEDRDRQDSYAIGANSFVRKPLDFAELTDRVTRLGVYWLSVNSPPLEPGDHERSRG